MRSENRDKPELELANRLALSVWEATAAIGVSEHHLRINAPLPSSLQPKIPHSDVRARVVNPFETLRNCSA